MTSDIDVTALDNHEESVDFYALDTLARVIALEERKTGRISGLRVFCRLDISVFRESESGKHSYFVNEITRSHGTALFPRWDSRNKLNFLYHHLSETLHYLAAKKMYLEPPPLSFK